ncbi:hypothetical protein KCP73_21610 [Salmonella enterica subsp. enterica]|nr:hypothetical protein KCP73_21610 [Salmonella enterica subsp. enterica]
MRPPIRDPHFAGNFISTVAVNAGKWAKPFSPSAMMITILFTPIVCLKCVTGS